MFTAFWITSCSCPGPTLYVCLLSLFLRHEPVTGQETGIFAYITKYKHKTVILLSFYLTVLALLERLQIPHAIRLHSLLCIVLTLH